MAEDIEITKAREKTDDRNYYLEIVSENPMLIEWANAEIRDDKEVILKAVNTDGGALEFARDRLKDDKDVVLMNGTRSRDNCYLCEPQITNHSSNCLTIKEGVVKL